VGMVEISRAFDETGNVVHINETSRYGKFYLFPDRKVELITKKGSVRAWHFAIKSEDKLQNNNCNKEKGMKESALHLVTKLYIGENCQKFLSNGKSVVLRKKLKNIDIDSVIKSDIIYSLLSDIDEVKVEESYKGYTPDISLYKNGRVIKVIEIVNTHDIEDELFKLYRADKIDVIVVDVGKFTIDSISELVNDTRLDIANFTNWFMYNSKISLYLNNMPELSKDIGELYTESISLIVEMSKVRTGYVKLLDDIKSEIRRVEILYYSDEGINLLRSDVDEIELESDSLVKDYSILLQNLKETTNKFKKSIEHNNKLFRYYVKSEEQYLLELAKRREDEEALNRQKLIELTKRREDEEALNRQKLRKYNIKLLRYWVKSEEQYLLELVKRREDEETLQRVRDREKELEFLGCKKTDKENSRDRSKRKNKRALNAVSKGVISLDFFEGKIELEHVIDSRVISEDALVKILEENGF
jgi:GH24 family phage-related lysozyme (muramidase)